MEPNTNINPSKQTEQANDNNMAIIAYITIVGLIIAYISNKDKNNAFTSFQIRQSLGLATVGLVLAIISLIPFLGWLIYIIGMFALLYLWIMGLINAINNKHVPVPFLGEKLNDWFKNV